MDANSLAKIILDAHENHQVIPPLREKSIDQSATLAYKIQMATKIKWQEMGRRIIGRKIGLTSKSVQTQLKVDQPDFGVLYDDMAFGSGEIVPYNRLLQPMAESEICFVLKHGLVQKRNSVAEVIQAVDFLLPAIEIADSRVENWDISFFDTVADNASSGLFVLGNQAVYMDEVDLEFCGMTMFKYGEPVSTGAGKACLGHPVNSLKWLADKMVELGDPLQAGDIVLSGALGPMVHVQPGDKLIASISGFSNVELILSNAENEV